MSNIYRKIVQF